MKHSVTTLIKEVLEEARAEGILRVESLPSIPVDVPKEKSHGDISSSIALSLASKEKLPPLEIARIILNGLVKRSEGFEKIEIAGPGFINFTFRKEHWYAVLRDILGKGDSYGRSDLGKGIKIQVEFVSANPTGPLHIGHGRGAAVGTALSNLLEAVGYKVEREFYINDFGRQVLLLGESVFAKYMHLCGMEGYAFPEDGYKGDYIENIAREFREKYRETYYQLAIDSKSALKGIMAAEDFAYKKMLELIKKDLEDFRVHFDSWQSEMELFQKSEVEKTIDGLEKHGYIYEREDALWFKSTDFGDDKDRVIKKQEKKGGEYTYFASDIAYHRKKIERKFDELINIWGADHHGYIPRIQAVIQALGYPKESLKVLLVQLVTLLREGKPVQMSKRAGEFVTLREVMDEVGVDAARYIFLTRRHDSHLEFDLEIAKKQSSENPVYYVQYAHARIASLFREASERGVSLSELVDTSLLNLPEELDLIRDLGNYPEIIEGSAVTLEPHRITYYLHGLASKLHSYYYKYRIITDDPEQTHARLFLIKAVGMVIRNALKILGVSAPERM